ncbi:hypothetical protein VB715_21100 [Crocosphaera sp. UHCC 0190]|uniref:hypothetical protein n=1 Tax=Crocosphaera sp. UHCC 0190 TaxID=3110246 RepID=UPI002B214760|nr:hypothetical protein [Crocosphaera sp. UHCC 0190]MEA5512273.1 hypothetical protein [Crocosphaera sp. UHCC 0190]
MMKINLTHHKLLLTLITPLITVGSISLSVPSQAATIVSISEIRLTINHVNQFAEDVSVIGDINTVAMAEEGTAQNQIAWDALFWADDSTVFAHANFQTLAVGTGSEYLLKTDIFTKLLGHFSIAAGNFLQFDVTASLYLENFVEDWHLDNASASGGISLKLFEHSTQSSLNLFNIFSFINTNDDQELNQDFFKLNISPDLILTSYDEQFLFGDNQEAIRVDFTGVFQQYFEQDTELDLIAVTQSCNSGSNTVDFCQKVPEVSNTFALIFLGLWVSSWNWLFRIMK